MVRIKRGCFIRPQGPCIHKRSLCLFKELPKEAEKAGLVGKVDSIEEILTIFIPFSRDP